MAQGPMSSILVRIRITVRVQESEVRNPHSLDCRKSYQRISMKFYGELWCGLETNWLHFGDDPVHRPDPGVRSGFRNMHSLDYQLPTDFDKILRKARMWPRNQLITFWWRSGSPSGSRSPKSEIRTHWIIDYRMLSFGGGLHCLRTSSYHIVIIIINNNTKTISNAPCNTTEVITRARINAEADDLSHSVSTHIS